MPVALVSGAPAPVTDAVVCVPPVGLVPDAAVVDAVLGGRSRSPVALVVGIAPPLSVEIVGTGVGLGMLDVLL